MYPSDFSSPSQAYVRVDDPLFLGLPPLLATMLILLILAIAAGMYVLGRRHADQAGDTDRVAEEIHRAILAASAAAMAASSNDLKGRAQALRDLVTRLLGPVLEVAKGLNPSLTALDDALKGERKGEAKPAAPSHGPIHGSCGCGKPEACTCARAPVTGPVTVNQVYIGGLPIAQSADCGCAGSHKPDCPGGHGKTSGPAKSGEKTEPQSMTGPEQIEALSRAVRKFHDHWLDATARTGELKAARQALSKRPPTAGLKPTGHHV
jgi:hypothetical protein